MALAKLTAMRSHDPQLQVGAVLVNANNQVLGLGTNNALSHLQFEAIPWASTTGEYLDTKFPYIVHAEQNAILKTNLAHVNNVRLYTTMFPCVDCARVIITAGIKEVHYLTDSTSQIPEFRDNFMLSKKLLLSAKVKLISQASLQKTLDAKIFRPLQD